MIFELGSIANWIAVAISALALTAMVGNIVFSVRRKDMQHVHTRVSEQRDKMSELAERLAKAEAELEHLPTREMVMGLATSLARMEGQLAAVNAKFDGVTDRMNGIGTAVDQLVENELRGVGK